MDNDKLNINLVGKNTDPNSPLNFAALRAKGIDLLQAFSGDSWTDYNLHDPGVTILEYLSYAITDLAYRTQFDIRDLLTHDDGKIDTQKNLFYSRKDIFATNPVTANDLRKLILDSDQSVYNVWLEKIQSKHNSGYIKGLYNVTIQLFEEADENAPDEETTAEKLAEKRSQLENAAIAKVKNIALNHRNLGEDYVSFTVLKPCIIEVEANIVISRHITNEEILAEVYAVILDTLNPPIHFYSEIDVISKGYTLDEMYSGAFLENGFLLDRELDPFIKVSDPSDPQNSARALAIDPSDILKAIAAIPGVLYIQHFSIIADGKEKTTPFNLGRDQYASFRFVKENRTITLSNENNELPVRESLFYSILYKKLDASKRKYIQGLHLPDESSVLKGVYQNVGHYFSFQHLFPQAYRLNIDEIDQDTDFRPRKNENETAATAKAKQLKAYLMFFEQILANYLSQLSNIDNLLTADIPDTGAATYFTQPLYDVPGVANILNDFFNDDKKEKNELNWARFKADPENGYVSFLKTHAEADDVFHMRKNRILNHLMSRFNLNLKKYPVAFFCQLFYPEQRDEKISAELKWKSGLLKELVALSSNRNRAHNYTVNEEEGNADDNKYDFETFMSRILYIQNTAKRKLSDSFQKFNERFSLQERDFYSAKSDTKMTSVKLDWLKGLKNEMIISEEELESETKQDEKSDGLRFDRQNISFLRDGLDVKNYKIGRDRNGTGYILIYRPPTETKWIRAGRFADRKTAAEALYKLIASLRDLNIESEGFHVVEHILLRPPLDARYFGFNFFDERGHVLFYQNQWMDFYEREACIEAIMSIADIMSAEDWITHKDYAKIAKLLDGKCRINNWEDGKLVKGNYNSQLLYQSQNKEDKKLAGELFEKMFRNIQIFKKKRMMIYPGIENIVNRLHDTDIPETFFHFRMTVVLPAWTARFQDKGFRLFTENLFREHTPAQIKLQFKWLGIGKMKNFEDLYFDWKERMLDNTQAADGIVKSDKLVSFINDGIYSIM